MASLDTPTSEEFSVSIPNLEVSISYNPPKDAGSSAYHSEENFYLEVLSAHLDDLNGKIKGLNEKIDDSLKRMEQNKGSVYYDITVI